MTTSGQRFRRRAFRRGYKVDEVDAFLDRVEATLAGQPVDTPVTAQEVRDVEFSVRFGGYDEWQVDLHLDRLERQLAEMAERGLLPGQGEAHTTSQAPVSPVPPVPHRPSPTPAGVGRYGQPEPPPPPRYDEQPTYAGQYDRPEAYSQDLTTEMHIGSLGAPEWARPPGVGSPVTGPPAAGVPTAGPHTSGGHPTAGPAIGRPPSPPPGPPPHLGAPVMGPPPPPPPPPPPMGGPGVVGPPPAAGHMTPGMGGVPAGDVQRVDELRRSFQPRRFGSGYDRAQVDELFERIIAGMTGRAPLSISEADLDPSRFDLVPGGYFEGDVDNALREVREIIRRL
ncbi:MAG: DivIVA domain-containing protein [Micromonosporaceae bacterium]